VTVITTLRQVWSGHSVLRHASASSVLFFADHDVRVLVTLGILVSQRGAKAARKMDEAVRTQAE
jgi:hypothetical protein